MNDIKNDIGYLNLNELILLQAWLDNLVATKQKAKKLAAKLANAPVAGDYLPNGGDPYTK